MWYSRTKTSFAHGPPCVDVGLVVTVFHKSIGESEPGVVGEGRGAGVSRQVRSKCTIDATFILVSPQRLCSRATLTVTRRYRYIYLEVYFEVYIYIVIYSRHLFLLLNHVVPLLASVVISVG